MIDKLKLKFKTEFVGSTAKLQAHKELVKRD